MNDREIGIVIPARLKSTRLPRKILADINGLPLIWHVWNRVCQAKLVNCVLIAADSIEVQQIMQAFGAEVLLTDPGCRSGTERIASVIDQIEADLIINVQGDEPLISPSLIDQLVQNWLDNPCDMITAARRIVDPAALSNPNMVKIVRAADDRALYFSRSPVPFVRDAKPDEWLSRGNFWQHIGIYGYARQLLENYPNLPESPLEAMEKLEQLRFLEAGYSIRVIETDYQSHAVDTIEDLVAVRKMMLQDQENG